MVEAPSAPPQYLNNLLIYESAYCKNKLSVQKAYPPCYSCGAYEKKILAGILWKKMF
jgi:hypothetical protein